jgi:hypothetical protein
LETVNPERAECRSSISLLEKLEVCGHTICMCLCLCIMRLNRCWNVLGSNEIIWLAALLKCCRCFAYLVNEILR